MTVLLLCAATATLLGVRYRGHTEAGWLDTAADTHLRPLLDGHPSLSLPLVALAHPTNVAVVTAALCLFCLHRRRLRALALTAVAIPGACALAELVLKPLVHRTYFGALAYPSGHATGAFAMAAVVTVLLVNPPRTRVRAAARAVEATASLVLAGAVCAAVFGAGSHYATDLVGGAAVAIAVVLATTLLLDLLPPSGVHRSGGLGPKKPQIGQTIRSPRSPHPCGKIAAEQPGRPVPPAG